MTTTTAAIAETTLTAEVRVLQVDGRHVTMGVLDQLDEVPWWHIEAWFGRVRPPDQQSHEVHIIGCHDETGALVRARIVDPAHIESLLTERYGNAWRTRESWHGRGRLRGPFDAAEVLGLGDMVAAMWREDEDWAEAAKLFAAYCEEPLVLLGELR